MPIIRDEEGLGVFMIPLFSQWGIRRCNVKGCAEKPTTILTNVHPQVAAMGLCEKHYQENLDGDGNLHLQCTAELDDYDAFSRIGEDG